MTQITDEMVERSATAMRDFFNEFLLLVDRPKLSPVEWRSFAQIALSAALPAPAPSGEVVEVREHD